MSHKTHRGSSPTPEPSASSTTTEAILTPASTTTSTPQRSSGTSKLELDAILSEANMEKERKPEKSADEAEVKQETKEGTGSESTVTTETAVKEEKPTANGETEDAPAAKKKGKKKSKCKKHETTTKTKAKSAKPASKSKAVTDNDSDSGSASDSDDESEAEESDSSSSSSSSEDEKAKKKRKARAKRKAVQKKKEKAKAKSKSKKQKKSKKHDSSSDSSDSDSESSSDSDSDASASSVEERPRKRRSSTKTKRAATVYDTATEAEETGVEDWTAEADTAARLAEQVNALQFAIQARQMQARSSRPRARVAVEPAEPAVIATESRSHSRQRSKKKVKKDKDGKIKKASTLEFKRVDQVWDSNIHAYKCQESAEAQEDEFDQYIFTVRRRFNWENKYRDTVIDLKSKILREGLQELMKDVKSISLVEEQPCLDPNTLFLYLEELRTFYKKTLKSRIKKAKKRKQIKHLETMRSHVKVMLTYLDEDYAETKKALYPLLEAGNITFEYLWALFKPNTMAYTTTYGTVDEPRCFKVDYAYKESSMLKGEWYAIEGRYLEYDGKHFGLGDFEAEIPSFRGPRKITSLPVYPLSYHKDTEKVKAQLLERGKKFVTLQGMNYKFSKGLAFQKRKQGVAKVNINGRIMIDPAIFRRINPNYRISVIKAKDSEYDDSDSESDCSGCDGDGGEAGEDGEGKQKLVWRFVRDKDDKLHYIQVPVDENGVMIKPEKLEPLANVEVKEGPDSIQHFDEEELLIASPVVYGFSFQEKLWLEFTLSSIKDIEWNEGAFESLVIPHSQKSIVKALVSSHKFHAAETIDDVVQGKGKGLVFVLHGPPGVGKTLTGEGIAEMLRCPLYMVSAGELGTDYRTLELELQKIMDIAHSWGAVLLLDEADVFLEKRQIHDISRNALVSIFLRILEYFQGILFLTTNRVETFDEAFQSRIHVALRYEELGHKAKKEIWKMFLTKVAVMEGAETAGLSDKHFEILARHNMNGRQIKNAVKTAQALAVNEKQKLSIEHIERVLAVAESFDRDLRGLTLDAMKSYI